MFSYIETCFGRVGSVDTGRDIVSENSSHESNQPFRRVKAYYIHTRSLASIYSQKCFSKVLHIFVILLPGPLHPLASSFDLQCTSFWLTLNITFKELRDSYWFKRCSSISTFHVNGKFSAHICCPEHIPSICVA